MERVIEASCQEGKFFMFRIENLHYNVHTVINKHVQHCRMIDTSAHAMMLSYLIITTLKLKRLTHRVINTRGLMFISL